MNVTPPVKPCVRSKVGSMVKDRRSIHISTFDLRPSTIRTVVVVVASQPKLELIFAYSFRSVACDESTLYTVRNCEAAHSNRASGKSLSKVSFTIRISPLPSLNIDASYMSLLFPPR